MTARKLCTFTRFTGDKMNTVLAGPFVEPQKDCWLYAGVIGANGYGLVRTEEGRYRVAHRVVYEGEVGPIPEGLQIDHLCRVRRCINPTHLEAVTPRENTRRSYEYPSNRVAYLNKLKTHCPKGHPYNEENTRIARMWGAPHRTQRRCRACKAQTMKAYCKLHPRKDRRLKATT